MDGSIDYSGYTLQELREALSRIDKNKYPLNFRNLQSEMASRPAPVRVVDVPSPVQAAVSTFAAAQPLSPLQRYRTFWRRFIAGFVDGLVLWPVTWMSSAFATDAWNAVALIAWNVFLYSAGPLYAIHFIFRHGATFGKMLAGLEVMDVSERRRPSLRQAILRVIGPVLFNGAALAYLIFLILANRYEDHESYMKQMDLPVAFLALGWALLEFITMFTNPKRRAVHDFIAGTVVVKVD